MATHRDYTNDVRPTWCPGCGDFGIWNALKRGLPQAGLEPHRVMMVTGIGCGSKMADYMRINGLHTLHGRTLAVATGYKLANHEMSVICVHGDGDAWGEGGNHFLSAVRRNIGLVDLVENNHIYGLTKGQYSPTSRQGVVTRTSPQGALEQPVNPLALAIIQGATFVARGFSLDIAQLTDLIVAAMSHRGYALIDVMQVCASFNRSMDYDWYRQRVFKVEDEGHDPSDRLAALQLALNYPEGDRIPSGILYRNESTPAYEEGVATLGAGALAGQPLRTRPLGDYQALLREFA
jgi:2-oxoglutarate ferredoxin oxidoreductase subunit beta